MKKIIFILLLFIPITLNATIWYVSPTGNDANDGTATDDGHAWKTWSKPWNSVSVQPGDTVYFRGGVYQKSLNDGGYYYPSRSSNGTGYNITRDGTASDTIKYWAYPGEVPILDCTGAYDDDERLVYGVRTDNAVNYVWFRGLTIRNVQQNPAFPGDELGYNTSQVWAWAVGGNYTVENCTIYNIHGTGLNVRDGATAPAFTRIINCDVHNCCDSLSTVGAGNDGYGFEHSGSGNVAFINCRAWLCGDYGFWSWTSSASHASQYTLHHGCWSFRNGMMEGGGQGYAMGWVAYSDGNIKRTYQNCFAGYNRQNGWFTLDYKYTYAVYANIYNCTAYHNGFLGEGIGGVRGYGISINTSLDTDANELLRVLKNNVFYGNEFGAVYIPANTYYTHEYNTWDYPGGAITVTDADFISVDSTGITGARGAGGVLPSLDFLHLADGQLNGVGVGVGLTYDADSLYHNEPMDLGMYSYSAVEPEPPEYPEVTTTVSSYVSVRATVTGTDLVDGGGTVSAKGICWNTSTNPTTANNIVPAGSGTDDFSCTLILPSNTTIYVRAYITNETATRYGAVVSFTTPVSSPVLNGTEIIVNGDGTPVIAQ